MQETRPIIRPKTIAAWVRLIVWFVAAAALVSLVLQFGFDSPPIPLSLLLTVQIAAILVYVASSIHTVWTSTDRVAALRSSWIDVVLLVGAVLFLFCWFAVTDREAPAAIYVAVMQVVLLVRLVIELVRLNLTLAQRKLHPTRLVALTFAVLIVGGGLALSLPKATHPHVREGVDYSALGHLQNCMFTATSATCVTGLTVYDTGADFTPLGRAVLLVLIQAGGLGIMIFGSAFGLLAAGQLSLQHSLVLQDALSYRTLGRLRTMIIFIVLFTLTAEAVGAVMLYPMWDTIDSFPDRVFHSVFHAVSAFCNAGFSLQTDSLISYNRAWQVYGCICPLITLGGLGFPVLHDLWQALVTSLRRRLRRLRGRVGGSVGPTGHRLTLHTRIVLVTSVVLIVVPTLGFFIFESFGAGAPTPATPVLRPPQAIEGRGSTVSPTTIAGASPASRLLDAFFYAVTCRTAGFNTVAMDPEAMSPASHVLGGILMFIGGSPASTAGGIKTVGLAVLLLGVWATIRGRTSVEAFGRTIPDTIVRRAAVVVFVMLAVISAVTMLLCFTEPVSLRAALFEAVSACGTVGLSTGLTPELTSAGRLVIMAAMFAGRLGPLTVLIALAGRARPPRYDYPSEQVTIG